MALYGALAEATRRGEVFERGETALDASNPTAITTGLVSITSVVLTLKGTAAPGVGTTTLTYDYSAGTLSVYAWKPTSSGNPTLIASTGTETFSWMVTGQLG